MSPSPRSKAVPRLAIEKAESFLQELPKKEKEHMPVSEAISGIADTVRAALAKGYSYNEISDMLSDKLGITVSPWSLRRYIPAGTRGKRSKAISAEATPKRGRKKKESSELNGSAPAAQAIATPTAIVEEPKAAAIEATPILVQASPELTPKMTRRRTTAAQGKAATPKANSAKAPAKSESAAKPAAKTPTTRGKTTAVKPAAKAATKPATNRRKKSS